LTGLILAESRLLEKQVNWAPNRRRPSCRSENFTPSAGISREKRAFFSRILRENLPQAGFVGGKSLENEPGADVMVVFQAVALSVL
jgi:hypothetical protein